ncbi:hypothetical protein G6F65_016477 [Rhizopus arrhizus]|nr:hypothetical protein G6F65_016477 [Rhizopus arrhizus]
MVERRPWLDILAHVILLCGVAMVAFPLYITFVASTQTAQEVAQAPMSLIPGPHFVDNYMQALFGGSSGGSSGAPVGRMMYVSLIMALSISIGKIAISLLSAFAVVYFRFPGRMLFFRMIFVPLMLPVEVRIAPTYKVVADLGLLNSYAGLTLPLIASATATFLFRQPGTFLLRRAAAAVQDQHRRPVRDPVHLWLEPIPVAAAHHHPGRHVPRRHRHQADDQRRRQRHRMEHHHGHRHAGHDYAGARRHPAAEMGRQGSGRH